MAFIFFDVETTNTDCNTGSIIEIGCVRVDDLMTFKSADAVTFYRRVNTDREMTKESQRVHGISKEDLASEPYFHQIVDDLLAFMGTENEIVAHNASFDMGFLNSELSRIGYPAMKNKVIDSLDVARKKYPGQKVGLDALATRLKLNLKERTLHNALEDAMNLSLIYCAMHAPEQISLVNVEAKKANPFLKSGLSSRIIESTE